MIVQPSVIIHKDEVTTIGVIIIASRTGLGSEYGLKQAAQDKAVAMVI